MQVVPGIVRRHPRTTVALLLLAVVLLVLAILWFEPHKLFVEERVSEARPGAPAMEAARMEQEAMVPPGPRVVAEGEFIGLEHETAGRAIVLETAGGRRFLRFEDFETSNGPDLVVYLSAKAPAGSDDW
jgi:Electron transfer DM13